MRPATDAVFTTWPLPRAIRRGTKLRTPWITPHRFTPTIHCQSPRLPSHAAASGETPALLQTTSAPPRSRSTSCAKRSTSSCFDTSTFSATALTPFASTCAKVSLTSATSPNATCMPSSAKASAIARPRPLAAPVTTATFPFSSFIAPPANRPLSPRVPHDRRAAGDDQPLHEEHMQVRVHAVHEPGGRRAAGYRRQADDHAGDEGVLRKEREALEQHGLRDVEHDADQGVCGE